MEEAQAYALKGIETINSELVENGNYGAFSTDDPDADGYYIVQWTGDPFTLQDDLLLESTDSVRQSSSVKYHAPIGGISQRKIRMEIVYSQPSE